ncbi:MAG: helix-turn-helix domain-containing protein [Candidatus Omnitrophica bacterium]|nr:helix-turn-helix domain-containing protein [Candidatus Omnitrophota bacterium]
MGSTHKLKPEIINFVIELRHGQPDLGCRQLAEKTSQKFNFKVSKSSINSLLKQQGLSLAVGRRVKKKKGIIETPGLGLIFLKAADALLGASQAISQVLTQNNKKPVLENQAFVEYMLYSPIFKDSDKYWLSQASGLWGLVEQKIKPDELSSYLVELQGFKAITQDITKLIHNLAQEVRCIKLILKDQQEYFIDAQMHAVWSKSQTPLAFSSTLNNVKNTVKQVFSNQAPCVLFMAPGYDKPTPELFRFMSNLGGSGQDLDKIVLFDQKLEELETIKLENKQKNNFVLGLWPWQFSDCRKVKSIGEFKYYYFEWLKEDLYVADTEIEITQPDINQSVTLRGYAIKRSSEEKTRLVILSDIPTEKITAKELVDLYLGHWSNLEEGFQDFTRKIERQAKSQNIAVQQLRDKFTFDGSSQNIEALLQAYLQLLDAYARRYFLPHDYENSDFQTAKTRIYCLKAKMRYHKSNLLINFLLADDYAYLKDLKYACARVNERKVVFTDKSQLWLENAF